MIVSIRDVRASYGEARALDAFSLDVAAGELVGVLGANGAGKTTLVRLLSGVTKPAAGTVEVAGRPLASYSPRERARLVAVVPQETSIAFPFRVDEVVMMGRFPHLSRFGLEGEADRAIALAAMEATGVERFRDRAIGTLSGGERQLVLVARAIAQEAQVLVLDEPTSFLDLRHQLRLYETLVRLIAERGLTVIAVSHDLNLAAQYGDRLVLMRAGRVLAAGPPDSVLTEENLHLTYGLRLRVLRDERSGLPLVVPGGGRPAAKGNRP